MRMCKRVLRKRVSSCNGDGLPLVMADVRTSSQGTNAAGMALGLLRMRGVCWAHAKGYGKWGALLLSSARRARRFAVAGGSHLVLRRVYTVYQDGVGG